LIALKVIDNGKGRAILMRLFVTGGTIDKVYNEVSENLEFCQTNIQAMLDQGRCTYPLIVEELMLKDSNGFTEKERRMIAKKSAECLEDRIIIVHGTSTAAETASALAKEVKDKTIVICGSMIPYCIEHTDALFNLGSAITAAQCLPHGIYITMNGKIFPANEVKKNVDKGIFEAL